MVISSSHASNSSTTTEPAIWFAPNNVAAYFQPDAKWQRLAEHTNVFVVPTQFLVHGKEEDVRSTILGVSERHIALALSGLMLFARNGCGDGIEGFTGPDDVGIAARRVKTLGSKIDFLTMDEPLWFAHSYAGPQACKMSISEVGAQVAARIKEARDVFPEIIVGDIEPVGNGLGKTWLDDVDSWVTQYEQTVGFPLAFLQLDPVWGKPQWQSELLALAGIAGSRNIPLGIIYNGIGSQDSDAQWTQVAINRADYIETKLLRRRPEQAIIASWENRPTRATPEDDTSTMSGFAFEYINGR